MRTHRLSPPQVLRTRRGQSLAFAVALLALIASVLVGAGATASAARPAASAGCSSAAVSGPTRIGGIGGLVRPTSARTRCAASAVKGLENPYDPRGNPPLLFHGGPMMSTQSTGDKVVVTPIFWEPAGFEFTASYKTVITTYLQGLAADSGKLTNVFSSMYQYAGSNGGINYKMQIGTPISDTTALPADACTLQAGDTTGIYADNTGYSHCIDDAQVIAETDSVVSAHSLPSDLGHMYVIFLPKHIESCFNAGATNTSANSCSLNHQPSAAFCAYHSQSPADTVYANMPFPAYQSGTNFSCTEESLGGGIQSPNGDTDADVEISPLSHEMAEAITDPDVNTGWWDANGFENGDECAYIYGTLSGTAGSFFNQTVNGVHYLTQEEFSNKDFVPSTSGCIQKIKAVKPGVKSLSKTHGAAHGGSHITIKGTGFPGTTSVHFGAKKATFTVLDAKHLKVTVPQHAKGTVDVTVTTGGGTSKTKKADRYTFK